MGVSLAFDPGLTGGVAVISGAEVKALPMPVSGASIDEVAVAKIVWAARPDVIVIERVGNMLAEDSTGDRTRKNGATSMFSFGQGYGTLRGICRAYQLFGGSKVQIDFPLPQQWKKTILPGAEKGKQGAIDYCALHYPQVNLVLPRCRTPHNGMADALCLARYGQKLIGE